MPTPIPPTTAELRAAFNRAAWTQDTAARTDTWDRDISHRTYCHIAQYEGTDRYCWQAVHGDYRLSGIEPGREAAMAQADATMALPLDEFNAQVSAAIKETMADLERKLLNIDPTAALLPGYHIGFQDGIAHARRLVGEALDLGEVSA